MRRNSIVIGDSQSMNRATKHDDISESTNPLLLESQENERGSNSNFFAAKMAQR